MDVKDFDKTCEFYLQGLGFDKTMEWEMDDGKRAAMIDSGNGNYLEIFEGREYEFEKGAYKHLAFSVDDCAQAIERAEKAGAEVTMATKELTIKSDPPLEVKIAFCKGPDGEILEFFQTC